MKFTIVVSRPASAETKLREEIMCVHVDAIDAGKACEMACAQVRAKDAANGISFLSRRKYLALIAFHGWQAPIDPSTVTAAK